MWLRGEQNQEALFLKSVKFCVRCVAEISEVKAKNQANKDLVEQLQGAVQMIDEEAERIRQEQNIEKARQAISQANLQRLSAAATLLQAYWRGLRQREEYIAMKKSARGKKGKKGKGKKK